MVFAFLLLKLNPFTPQPIKQIGKAVFATGCMTVVILLTRSLFILVPATLGMAVFLLVAWKLQVLGAEEQSKLRDLVSRKLGRFAGRKRSPS